MDRPGHELFSPAIIEEVNRKMELKELNLFRDALVALAKSCDFNYKIDDEIELPENAIVLESNGIRFRYRGSDRLVKNYKGDIYFFNGRKWSRVKTQYTKKVAICPK